MAVDLETGQREIGTIAEIKRRIVTIKLRDGEVVERVMEYLKDQPPSQQAAENSEAENSGAENSNSANQNDRSGADSNPAGSGQNDGPPEQDDRTQLGSEESASSANPE